MFHRLLQRYGIRLYVLLLGLFLAGLTSAIGFAMGPGCETGEIVYILPCTSPLRILAAFVQRGGGLLAVLGGALMIGRDVAELIRRRRPSAPH